MRWLSSADKIGISLEHTIGCGQVFRWKQTGTANSTYQGYIKNRPVEVKQKTGTMDFTFKGLGCNISDADAADYFRLDDNLVRIYRGISKDKFIRSALKDFRGLRLIRQEPFECLVSFICSAASNVPKISTNVESIARQYGTKIKTTKGTFHSFPTPKEMRRATASSIRKTGVGFRAKYIINAVEAANSWLDIESLRGRPYNMARKELMQIDGVGEKIADCVLLFSLDKLESFPVDRWIWRVMTTLYPIDEKSGMKKLHGFASKRFGAYAGYAQQYLFHASRCGGLLDNSSSSCSTL